MSNGFLMQGIVPKEIYPNGLTCQSTFSQLILTHFMNQKYWSFQQSLGRFSLDSALNYVSVSSRALLSKEPTWPFNTHLDRRIDGFLMTSRAYNTNLLCFLASELITNASGEMQFGIEAFNTALEQMINLSTPEDIDSVNVGDTLLERVQFLMPYQYASQLELTSARFLNRFGRFIFLYDQLLKQSSGTIMSKYLELFKLKYDLSVREFAVGCFSLSVLAANNGYKIRPKSVGDLPLQEVPISGAHLQKVAEAISLEVDSFREHMRKPKTVRANQLGQMTELNPFRLYPLTRVSSEEFYCPVPQILFYRGTSCFDFDMQRALTVAQYEDYRNRLGKVFEDYIHCLLRNMDASLDIHIDLPYRINKLEYRTCDFVIPIRENLVLIECKITPAKPETKSLMGSKTFQTLLKTTVCKGLEEIVRTKRHILDGHITIPNVDIANITNWIGVVVTLDEMGIRPHEVTIIDPVSSEPAVTLNTEPVWQFVLEEFRRNAGTTFNAISEHDIDNFPHQNLSVLSADDFENYLGQQNVIGAEILTQIIRQPIFDSAHPFLKSQVDRFFPSRD